MVSTDAVDLYLRQAGLRRAFHAARSQVERLDRIGGTVTLEQLSEEEASALSGLLGALRRKQQPRTGRPFRLAVRDVDLALRESRFELSLLDALERIGPPLDPAPRRRASERAALEQMWADAVAHPLCADEPRVRAWVDRLRTRGFLPRTDGRVLLTQSLELGARLPSVPQIERTRLASSELGGDPHALDDDRPLSRLVLGQLAFRADEPRPSSATERRLLWQRFGVTCDSASADVLTLGLRPLPHGPLARALLLLEGWHFRLTVGQLAREPLYFPASLEVFLCENVTVLTAAEARYGTRCAPLVCLEGWPSSAGWALLDALATAGATLRYHGDFDWDGVRIAGQLRARHGVLPWRFDASHYHAGLASHRERTRKLDGRPAAEGGDGALVAAMREAGRELHEEAVLEELLSDLGAENGK